MTQREHSTVVGVFRDSDRAREAIEALKERGFASEDIGVLMRDKGETKDFAAETGTQAGQGAATGAIGGGILGGLAGWMVGIGALIIPGVGPFIAAGAFGTALAGAGIGAGVGLIAGALVGMGIPKEEADWYEGEVKSGNTLVSVNASGRYDEVKSLLNNYGAYDIHDQSQTAGTGTLDSTGMQAPGRTGSFGAVPMESREGGQFTDRGTTTEDERTMTLREETNVGKRNVQESEHVSDTVRREDARVDRTDDFEVVGGENFPEHTHRWSNGRCEICNATQRRNAA